MSPSEDKHNRPNLAQRYEQLSGIRSSYLDRARECAALTIPTLIPPESNSSGTKYPTPRQSVGSRGVNSISARYLLTLFPPNEPFFRLTVAESVLAELSGTEGARGEVEEAMASIERSIMLKMETTPIRPIIFEAFKHLIVAGNVCLHFLPGLEGAKLFRLDRYVCKRDPMGNLLEIIVKEDLSLMEVPEELREELKGTLKASMKHDTEDSLELYTCVRKKAPGEWEVWQEINGLYVEASEGEYTDENLPWLVFRYNEITGEDYGRGLVEEYLGDLRALEGLRKAILDGAAAASKVIFLVKPNGTTKQRALAQAENGAIINGNRQDVDVLQVDKYADFKVAQEQAAAIEESLSYAFLLNSAIQRNGERVTAEEIRYLAAELETARGGSYSAFTQSIQRPTLRIIMSAMEAAGELPKLPKGIVKPLITTGIEAIGRGNDLQKLMQFVGILEQVSKAEGLELYLDKGELIKRTAASLNIDVKGLVIPAEQRAEMQQEAMMQSMISQGLPNAVNALGGMAKQEMINQQQQP
ncbi:portal protein [Oxalobacter vibrioformis]|uniref:Portal protein n=1 Tax=Oxalobacter vibrioformis TaxID=933080 RepID=A0A9E9LVL5_9BURK|nr:portal protein [Oxalobacter vibrioformis]WAW09996.1 portal protein [Oxalobacter vibrioformis]